MHNPIDVTEHSVICKTYELVYIRIRILRINSITQPQNINRDDLATNYTYLNDIKSARVVSGTQLLPFVQLVDTYGIIVKKSSCVMHTTSAQHLHMQTPRQLNMTLAPTHSPTN